MTILISGSSGFLGKKLLNALKEKFKRKVYIISYKKKNVENFIHIQDTEKLAVIKKLKNKINLVIHLATKYEDQDITKKQIYDVNYTYSMKLYEFSKKINSNYFLNISTILNDKTNYYSYTKNLFKKTINNEKKIGMRVINCNLDMMFGYYDKRFFHNIVTSLLRGDKDIHLTSCYQIRNIIFVDELIDQFIYFIMNIKSLNKININMGAEYEIRLKTFILLISNSISKRINGDVFSKLQFGKKINRKNERIFKSYKCDKVFKKNLDKKVYLKKLENYISQEIKKYDI